MGLLLVVVVLVVGWYFLYAKRGGGQGAVERHFQLDPGERCLAYWSAELATEISTLEKAGVAALGLLAGALVGGVGIVTVRPRGLSMVLTSQARLVLMLENEDGSVARAAFRPGEGLAIEVVGDGQKKLQGGATKVLRLNRPGTPPVDVLVHHSAEAPLLAWAARGEVPASRA